MNYSILINRKTFFHQLNFPWDGPLFLVFSSLWVSQPAHAFGYRRREWRSTVVCGSSPLPPTIVTLLGSLLLPLSMDSIVDMELLIGEREWLVYQRFHSIFYFISFYYFAIFTFISILSFLCITGSLAGHLEKAVRIITNGNERRKELSDFFIFLLVVIFVYYGLIFPYFCN